MAIKMSQTVRNARLDAVEAAIGVSPVLKIRSGAPPANIADADSGAVLATLVLPADWMQNASGGSKLKRGTWQDVSADNSGTAGHFRIYASDGVTQHLQGVVSLAGGGGNIILDDLAIIAGDVVFVTTFTLVDGNA